MDCTSRRLYVAILVALALCAFASVASASGAENEQGDASYALRKSISLITKTSKASKRSSARKSSGNRSARLASLKKPAKLRGRGDSNSAGQEYVIHNRNLLRNKAVEGDDVLDGDKSGAGRPSRSSTAASSSLSSSLSSSKAIKASSLRTDAKETLSKGSKPSIVVPIKPNSVPRFARARVRSEAQTKSADDSDDSDNSDEISVDGPPTDEGEADTGPESFAPSDLKELDRVRKEVDERSKHTPSLVDGCVFAKECKENWERIGLSGIILRNKFYADNPFMRGGKYNDNYMWSHPSICCAKTNKALIQGSFSFSDECKQPAESFGTSGMLFKKDDYFLNPFQAHAGGPYNDNYAWVHPQLCLNHGFNKDLTKTLSCVMGKKTCPKGFKDRGELGVLFLQSHYQDSPFASGVEYNDSWRWTHPRLCCSK